VAVGYDEEEAATAGEQREHPEEDAGGATLQEQPDTVGERERDPAARAGPDEHPRARTQQQEPAGGERSGDEGGDN